MDEMPSGMQYMYAYGLIYQLIHFVILVVALWLFARLVRAVERIAANREQRP